MFNGTTDVTFDDLFNVPQDLEPIEIPELGGKKVYRRQLSAAEVRDFIQGRDVSSLNEMSQESFTEMDKLIARSIVDADGKRIIPEGDEHLLSTLPYKTYLRLANATTAGVFEDDESEGDSVTGEEAASANPTTA